MNLPKFEQTMCSSCGQVFGPGDSGFSHCDQHEGLESIPGSWARLVYSNMAVRQTGGRPVDLVATASAEQYSKHDIKASITRLVMSPEIADLKTDLNVIMEHMNQMSRVLGSLAHRHDEIGAMARAALNDTVWLRKDGL